MVLTQPATRGIIKNTFIHFPAETGVAHTALPRSSSCPARGDQLELSHNFVVSVGSASHFSGRCRPCAWRWRESGCAKGLLCPFCHLCEDGTLKLWKRKKLSNIRERRAMDKTCRKATLQESEHQRGGVAGRRRTRPAEMQAGSRTSGRVDRHPSRGVSARGNQSHRSPSRRRPVDLQDVSFDALLREVQNRVPYERDGPQLLAKASIFVSPVSSASTAFEPSSARLSWRRSSTSARASSRRLSVSPGRGRRSSIAAGVVMRSPAGSSTDWVSATTASRKGSSSDSARVE